MASEYLSFHVWPAYLGAVATVALVFLLMRHAAGRPLHRILALYLIAYAGVGLMLAMGQVAVSAGDARAAAIAWQLWGAASRGMLLVLVFSFAPFMRWRKWAILVAFALVSSFLVRWAIDGAEFMKPFPPSTSTEYITFGNWQFDIVEPVAIPAVLVMWLATALAPLILTVAFRATQPGRARRSLGVVLGLLSAGSAFWSFRAFMLVATGRLVGRDGILAWAGHLQWIAEGAVGVLALVASLYLLRNQVAPRRLAGFAAALALIAATAAGVSIADYRGPYAALVDGFRLLAVPLVLSYALLRNSLFDLDVKARFTVKGSTLAAIFIAVIFVVGEGAQVVFGEEQQWIGIMAGAALVFALAPLQRFANRVADAAVPGAKASTSMSLDEKQFAYEELVRMAWLDGSVSLDERHALDAARERLKLDEGAAHRIERSVVQSFANASTSRA